MSRDLRDEEALREGREKPKLPRLMCHAVNSHHFFQLLFDNNCILLNISLVSLERFTHPYFAYQTILLFGVQCVKKDLNMVEKLRVKGFRDAGSYLILL